MSRSSRFWDRIAERYAKQPIADEAAYQKKLEITRSYLRPSMEVLEIGCGTGSTAIDHAPFVQHIHAIDISAKMIEIAKRKAEAAKVENVSFSQSTIDECGVGDQSVGAALALSVLHLLEDWEDAIARVHAMLEPGGVFVTSTMCLGDSFRFLAIVAPLGRILGLMPMLSFFSAEELAAGFRKAGFTIEERWQTARSKPLFIVARKPA